MPIEWNAVKGAWDCEELSSKVDAVDFEMILHRVKIGIKDDARTFLLSCALYFEEGEQLPFSFLVFLAERFRKMASAANPFDVSLLKRPPGPDASKNLDHHARVAEEVRALVTTRKFGIAKAARYVSHRRHAAAGTGGKEARVLPERAERLYRKFFGTPDSIYRKGAIKEIIARPAWMDAQAVDEMARAGEDQLIQMFVIQTGIKVVRPRWIKRPLPIRRQSTIRIRRKSRL